MAGCSRGATIPRISRRSRRPASRRSTSWWSTVDHQEVDRRDAGLLDRREMRGIVAPREQPAMDGRIQRLDAPVAHLRETGVRRYLLHRYAVLLVGLCVAP